MIPEFGRTQYCLGAVVLTLNATGDGLPLVSFAVSGILLSGRSKYLENLGHLFVKRSPEAELVWGQVD